MRHFLDIASVDAADLRSILDLAKAIKAARADLGSRGAPDPDPLLAGHMLGMVFEKPSTRTRLSFDVGIRQMGGSTVVVNSQDMQLGRGETIPDTARVMSRFVDAIMLRSDDHDKVLTLAEHASVPVINGLTPRSHPCQIMADLMTIEEHLGTVEGRTVAWVGDGNNVCVSFIEAAAQFNFTMRIAHPDGYAPDADAVLWARGQGAQVEFVDTVFEAVAGVDVVVTDTWVSMSDNPDEDRLTPFQSYSVTEAVMEDAADHAIFLHCLPAHRGEEVVDAVIDGPQSVVWDEAENRLHAQKAIVAWCLNALV